MKQIGMILLILFLTVPGKIFAAPPVVLDDTHKKYILGKHIDIIEDKAKTLTFEEVISDKFSRRWKSSQVVVPNFGYTNSAFWIRFSVANSTPQQGRYNLEVAYPYLDRIDFYIPDTDKYIQKTSGDHFPFSSREIKYKNFVFTFQIPSGTHTYYMRMDSMVGDNLILPITLWTANGFTEMVALEQMVIGIYYGAMFVILIYSLFLFVTLNEKSYFYNLWFVLGFALFQACEEGLATQYLWQDNYWLVNYGVFFVSLLGTLGMIKFAQAFLNTPQLTPRLDKLITGLIYAHVLLLVILLLVILTQPILPAMVPTSIAALSVCSVTVLLFTSLVCLQYNFRSAGYFLMAETGLLCGLAIVSLRITGVLPVVFLTQYGAQIGSLVTVIFLFFGLMDNINITKREREEYLTKIYSLIDSSKDLIFLKDTGLRYQIANKAHEAVFPVKVDEIIAKTDHDFMPDDEADKCRESDIKALQSGYISLEENILSRIYHVVKHRVVDAKDRVQGIAAVIRDITDQKKIESEKKALNERLQQAQKLESIGTLAGGIAHDFNNILYAAIGFTELAYDEVEKDSDVAQYLKNVIVSHKRASDLVNQILTFSRQKKIDIRPIRIQTALKEAVDMIRKIIPANIEIELEIDEKCDPILADMTQIHQVVMNLCTNAYHAMQEKGGTMTIRLDRVKVGTDGNHTDPALEPGDYTKLEVSDTGQGMEPEVLNRIFEPFFTTKSVGKGTGLGLSTVHGIVNEYGGVVHVTSQPGRGTSFYLFFPTCLLEEAQGITGVEEANGKGRETILFVDDDDMIVHFTQRFLSDKGYQIHPYNNVVEAFEAFRDNPFWYDLVITDLKMPRMTGMELSEKIFQIRPAMPIILCTGFSEDVSKEKAIAMGIAELMYKPVRAKDLLKVIRKVVAGDPKGG